MKGIWSFCSIILLTWHPLAAGQELPPGKGKDVLERMCTVCHGLDTATGPRLSKERWSKIVDDMVVRGATGTDQEIDLVLNYLATNFGPKRTTAQKINVNKANARELSLTLELTIDEAFGIIRYRDKNGDFKGLADLKKVPGLLSKKIEDKKGSIEF
jgi:competence ComEA-like helix-hairpin-helix protein